MEQRPLLIDGFQDASCFTTSQNRVPSSSSDYHQIVMNDDDDGEEEDDDGLLGDCGYSRPFFIIDVIWNMAFVLVSIFMLLSTIGESPSAPLRLWIGGYALQCLLHVGFVWVEYQRVVVVRFHGLHSHALSIFNLCHSSIMQSLVAINTVISSIWWVFGLYWIIMGGQALLQDSPHLYWLSVTFLAFDVFFVIFCITMVFMLFFAFFCCVPILAAVAYAMKLREGASENDIMTLPKYSYVHSSNANSSISRFSYDDNMTLEEGSSTPVLSLNLEDSECSICLNRYSEGVELCRLPCNHHFHHGCVCKWLRINATCPLCKFNILRKETLV
ncbi:unnamed protein product [Cuscuta epithymum]|uniref:RING-type E3 ubiquitin transferase n=1 Tax=Cuscuta epithymum TaxID=186058 RepID=A0AAV0DYJ1_9ASTE|nr:unnamed protein product [Cuscuta epithymum]